MSDGIVLFESADSAVTLDVATDGNTVWLSQAQMVELFGRDQSVISRHVGNVFKEGELDRESSVHFLHIPSSDKPVAFYNLDVVISVGYRVKSQRGVEFRRWATGVLRRYIIEGAAANERRLAQLGKVAQVMARIPDSLETRQVLDIVSSYTAALDFLDDYDHQRVRVPEGSKATHVLSYEECRYETPCMDAAAEGRFGAFFAYALDASVVSSSTVRCGRAGAPRAIVSDGMSLFTTEFDPMMTLSPMVAPGKIVQLAPIQTSRPILITCARLVNPRRALGCLGWSTVVMTHPGAIIVWSPISMGAASMNVTLELMKTWSPMKMFLPFTKLTGSRR